MAGGAKVTGWSGGGFTRQLGRGVWMEGQDFILGSLGRGG